MKIFCLEGHNKLFKLNEGIAMGMVIGLLIAVFIGWVIKVVCLEDWRDW